MNSTHPSGAYITLYPPSMTRILVVAIGVVFAMTWIAGGPDDLTVLEHFGANFGILVADGELWRLVASMFLHGGVLHLALNGYALYLLGRNIEAFYGRWAFLFLVLASGVIGSIASAMRSDLPSVGASGGIFGLLGASIVFAFRFRGVLPPRVTKVMGTALLPWVALNIGLGVLIPFIDMNAHIGGLLGGAALAFVVSPRALREAAGTYDPATSRSLASASLAILLVTAVSAGEHVIRTRGMPIDPRVASSLVWNDPQAALRDLNQALAENPDDPELLMARAQIHTIAENWIDAIRDYQHVLAIAPDNGLAANNLAWVLLEEAPEELRNWTEAERLATKALALSPDDPYVLGTYGTMRLRRGDSAEAAEYLGRALEKERPRAAESTDRYLLAIALSRSGDKAGAEKAFRRAVRTDPGNPYRSEARAAVEGSATQSAPSL
jgi:rhomboid protease GluP